MSHFFNKSVGLDQLDPDLQKRYSREWTIGLIVVMLIMMFLRFFVFEINVVRGSSMDPTLSDGDILLSGKATASISRWDIVMIDGETREGVIVKRVAGLPGEHVTITDDGTVFINDERLDDPFACDTTGKIYPCTDVMLGEGQYFVLGDNRRDSYDSRYFGAVDVGKIRSVARFRFWRPSFF